MIPRRHAASKYISGVCRLSKSLVYHACHHNHPETQAGLYQSSTRFRAPRNTQLQLSTYDIGLPPT
ncbi:hypothetical protein CORMATOL_00497 [Corynebacterium matruchotii ATCC 33806]|uniref:Uncharacterized protein n=1 Tax=Corynebacterium matruchotii ATCC 33806 TaxID=566549 RepID=C0E0J7_9CORY|nr:hypothetical protein CORMATOL_00497 [Corynebacterium matruchotii ATCC 33806]